MIVILGAGEYGIQIRNQFFSNENDVVFYDNDRRKWGKIIADTKVITLEHFQELAKLDNTKIIIGGQSSSLLFFLKDIKPVCQVLRLENEGGDKTCCR